MIKNKIKFVLPLDNTKRFICAIHDKNIKEEILTIYLHPVDKYNKKTPQIKSSPSTWYEDNLKKLIVINDRIKNNKYNFIVCDENNTIIHREAHLMEEYKNITNFELVTITKQITFITLSKKSLQAQLQKEKIKKQNSLDEIKNILISDNINVETIKQLQSILGLKE